MYVDALGGLWLVDPMMLLVVGVAIFAVLSAAHAQVKAEASESWAAERAACTGPLAESFRSIASAPRRSAAGRRGATAKVRTALRVPPGNGRRASVAAARRPRALDRVAIGGGRS